MGALPEATGLYVAVDTETSGTHPDDGATVSVVSIAYEIDGELIARAFPFDQGQRDKLAIAQDSLFATDTNLGASEWRTLLGWLAQQRLIFHNAKFDLHMLRCGTRSEAGLDLSEQMVWDTMLVQRLLDPLQNVGLKETAARIFGVDEREAEQQLARTLKARKLKKNRIDLLDWDDVKEYATKDAELTYRLWDHQIGRIDEGETDYRFVRLEIELCRVLYRMESRGLGYDAAASLIVAAEIEKRAKELATRLPFAPTLNGAKDYFFKVKGVVPVKVTEKGAPQLDDEVLSKLIGQGVPYASEYSELGTLQRANSMWYEAYARMCGADGRLRTNYRQAKVVSGRMSVERVQLQAIPKLDKSLEGIPPVRSLFRAKPGHELWNLDLSQAELRVAAQFARCTKMLEMLADGADLHGITTQEVLGTYPDDPNWKRDRDIAKRLTFGGIFQIGGRKFQATLSKLAGIEMPLTQAEEIVKRWRQTYPEFGRAYRQSEHTAQQKGYVRLVTGRPSWFGPREYLHSAWNRRVQGSLAEFLKIWLVDLERNWPGLCILTVHDSVVLELPEDGDPEGVSHEIAKRAADMATRLFKIEMKVDVGPWLSMSSSQTDYASFQAAL